MLLNIEGSQFAKDTRTSAILTVDRSVLAQNEARKKIASKINSKNDTINRLENDVDFLKNNLQEIKLLLKQLIEIGK